MHRVLGHATLQGSLCDSITFTKAISCVYVCHRRVLSVMSPHLETCLVLLTVGGIYSRALEAVTGDGFLDLRPQMMRIHLPCMHDIVLVTRHVC